MTHKRAAMLIDAEKSSIGSRLLSAAWNTAGFDSRTEATAPTATPAKVGFADATQALRRPPKTVASYTGRWPMVVLEMRGQYFSEIRQRLYLQ